jgi:hypothetical protein
VGPLAQLVAHLHDAQGVTGSSPVRPTKETPRSDSGLVLTTQVGTPLDPENVWFPSTTRISKGSTRCREASLPNDLRHSAGDNGLG